MFLMFKILRVRNSAWDFLALIFGPGIFSVFVESPWDFLGLEFCSHSIISIPSSRPGQKCHYSLSKKNICHKKQEPFKNFNNLNSQAAT